MAERVRVREITNDEGNRLLRIVRRDSGSVVRWRRAQMVLLSAQGMEVAQIAKVAFTSPDRVREVLHNFNDDGFDSLDPRYAGGRPPRFTLPQRREIKRIALSRPTDHDLPFSTRGFLARAPGAGRPWTGPDGRFQRLHATGLVHADAPRRSSKCQAGQPALTPSATWTDALLLRPFGSRGSCLYHDGRVRFRSVTSLTESGCPVAHVRGSAECAQTPGGVLRIAAR